MEPIWKQQNINRWKGIYKAAIAIVYENVDRETFKISYKYRISFSGMVIKGEESTLTAAMDRLKTTTDDFLIA